jgi:hypothetical protein
MEEESSMLWGIFSVERGDESDSDEREGNESDPWGPSRWESEYQL